MAFEVLSYPVLPRVYATYYPNDLTLSVLGERGTSKIAVPLDGCGPGRMLAMQATLQVDPSKHVAAFKRDKVRCCGFL